MIVMGFVEGVFVKVVVWLVDVKVSGEGGCIFVRILFCCFLGVVEVL